MNRRSRNEPGHRTAVAAEANGLVAEAVQQLDVVGAVEEELAEAGPVVALVLSVDHDDAGLGQAAGEVDDAGLGSIWEAVEHRFAGEHPPGENAVAAADQLVAGPDLE